MLVDDDRTEIFNRSHLLGLEAAEQPEKPERALGARAIVAYKLIRSGLSLVLAIGLAVLLLLGKADAFVQFAIQLRQHFSSHFAGALADQLLRGLVPARLWFVVGALGVDGLFTAVEGFALRTGRPWGTWLVLIATTALVPFEVAGLLRAPHVGRAILLLLNVAVGVYLLRRAMRKGL